jgi:O-antigen/teichoic acid export membrane protein
MNGSNDNERLFIAKWALVLFILGLLAPLLIAALIVALAGPRAEDTAAPLAVGFGFVCEVLAFVLGIVGRRHASGKIGMLGGVVVLVLAIAAATVALLKYQATQAELQERFEERKTYVQERFEEAKRAMDEGLPKK